jgi:hypothetical protein
MKPSETVCRGIGTLMKPSETVCRGIGTLMKPSETVCRGIGTLLEERKEREGKEKSVSYRGERASKETQARSPEKALRHGASDTRRLYEHRHL